MKTIGMLGGMSWQSTELYYRAINEMVRDQLGGLHSAKIILHSVDFAGLEVHLRAGAWDKIAEQLSQAALGLQQAGADFVLICTNTMHMVAPQISEAVTIPVLHLADATAIRLKQAGITKVGLLGTAYTMEQDFYKQRIEAQGIEVVIPNVQDRAEVNRIVFEELCLGDIKTSSRQYYLDTMQRMQEEGAQAIIEGCTEITMLIKPEHAQLPLFDTTAIHAEEAVAWALSEIKVG